MKEKFRLWCDLNNITDIHDMDAVAEQIAQFSHIQPYHRYSYLFRGYHDLTHGQIDDETFFALGDITSDKQLFSSHQHAGLETMFAIEDNIAKDTLYIVEDSAFHYYVGKKGHDAEQKLLTEMTVHGSHLMHI